MEENYVAKNRWKLLAKAIGTNTKEETDPDSCSVKHPGPFGLIFPEPFSVSCCNGEVDKGYQWFRYTFQFYPSCNVVLRQVARRFTKDELVGFDNTGNVCVWPSEEVLAHYCLVNANSFAGKRVIELGGGMTCLAGLTVCKFAIPASVCLTDGNDKCVNNIHAIVSENMSPGSNVEVRRLDWKDSASFRDLCGSMDYVLCADCAFFDDRRQSLVSAIWNVLVAEGVALVMAPRRGDTLQKFLELCRGLFIVSLHEDYDSSVTSIHHTKLQENPGYKPDIHYPLLVKLQKI